MKIEVRLAHVNGLQQQAVKKFFKIQYISVNGLCVIEVTDKNREVFLNGVKLGYIEKMKK